MTRNKVRVAVVMMGRDENVNRLVRPLQGWELIQVKAARDQEWW